MTAPAKPSALAIKIADAMMGDPLDHIDPGIPEACDAWTRERDKRAALIDAEIRPLVEALRDLLRFAASVRPGGAVLATDPDLPAARAALARCEGGGR